MAFIDKTTLAQVIATSFDSAVIRPLRPKYIFDEVCKEKLWNLNTNPNKGDTMVFVSLAAESANTAAASSTATTINAGGTLTHTRRSVTLVLYGTYSVVDLKESHAETFVDDVSDAAFNLSDQARNSLNLLAKAAMDLNKFGNEVSGTLSNTYHRYGSYGAGTPSTVGPMKAKDIRAIVSQFRGDNVEPFEEGLYRGIINNVQYTQIRSETDGAAWTETLKYVDNSQLLIGDIGVFEGVRFIVNNQVTGQGTNTVSSYFLGREFCGKAIGADLEIKSGDKMEGRFDNLLKLFWTALVGYKIIRREAGIIMETTNSSL